jgi:hypothetical protein
MVSRFDEVRRVTPIQTYVKQSIDLPFEDMREDIKAAQLEQDTNRAAMLDSQKAALEAVSTYEGASQEEANRIAQDYNDKITNMLKSGDLRGMQKQLGSLAGDFAKDMAVGELYEVVVKNNANMDQYKQYKDAPGGTAWHQAVSTKHEENKQTTKTGDYNKISPFIYDDSQVQKELSTIVDAKNFSYEYESDSEKLKITENLTSALGQGSSITPVKQTVVNEDGTTSEVETGRFLVSTTNITGLSLNRAQLNALGNALASESIYNRAVLEHANELVANKKMNINDAIDAAQKDPEAIKARIADDVVGRVAGASGHNVTYNSSLSGAPSTKGSGSNKNEEGDNRFVLNSESEFYDIQKKTGSVDHNNFLEFYKQTYGTTTGDDINLDMVVHNFEQGKDGEGNPLSFSQDGEETTVTELFNKIDETYNPTNENSTYIGVNGIKLARLEKDKVLLTRMANGQVPGENSSLKETVIEESKQNLLVLNNAIDDLNQFDIEFKKRMIKKLGSEEAYNNYVKERSTKTAQVGELYKEDKDGIKTKFEKVRNSLDFTKELLASDKSTLALKEIGLNKKDLPAYLEVVNVLSNLSRDESVIFDVFLQTGVESNKAGVSNVNAKKWIITDYLKDRFSPAAQEYLKSGKTTSLFKKRSSWDDPEQPNAKGFYNDGSFSDFAQGSNDAWWGPGQLFALTTNDIQRGYSTVEGLAERMVAQQEQASKTKEAIRDDFNQNNLLKRNLVRYPKGLTQVIPDKRIEGKLVDQIEKIEANLMKDSNLRGEYVIRSANGQETEGIKGSGTVASAEQITKDLGKETKLEGKPFVKGYYQVGDAKFQVTQRKYVDKENNAYILEMTTPVKIDIDTNTGDLMNFVLDRAIDPSNDADLLMEKIDTESSPEYFLGSSSGITNDYFEANYGDISVYHPTKNDVRGNQYLMYIGKNVKSDDVSHRSSAQNTIKFRDQADLKGKLKAIQETFAEYDKVISTIKDEMTEEQKGDIRANAQRSLDEMIKYLKK